MCQGKKYAEVALNTADWNDLGAIIGFIRSELAMQDEMLKKLDVSVYETGILDDEPLEFFGQKETEYLPEEADLKELAGKLISISDKGMEMGSDVIECIARAQSTHISKMFLTPNRDLRQAYVYSEGIVAAVVSAD